MKSEVILRRAKSGHLQYNVQDLNGLSNRAKYGEGASK